MEGVDCLPELNSANEGLPINTPASSAYRQHTMHTTEQRRGSFVCSVLMTQSPGQRLLHELIGDSCHTLAEMIALRIVSKGRNVLKIERVNVTASTKSNVRPREDDVVAAGAMHAPQILQLLGVGDAIHLEKLGIKSFVKIS